MLSLSVYVSPYRMWTFTMIRPVDFELSLRSQISPWERRCLSIFGRTYSKEQGLPFFEVPQWYEISSWSLIQKSDSEVIISTFQQARWGMFRTAPILLTPDTLPLQLGFIFLWLNAVECYNSNLKLQYWTLRRWSSYLLWSYQSIVPLTS